tara:strand:+ start:486 stop:1046 length:561 start_codon:yes stop_codon:yes gene_type:complete
MKRAFDLLFVILIIIILSIPMLCISFVIKLNSKGGVLYWSERNGINNCLYKMPKFRSMKIGTPELASHLILNPDRFLTPIGVFIRRFSLDELPQLFSILKGDMSFVGPRPALYNQYDLIELRTEKGVHLLLPGITGWAQVNGRDKLSVTEKVFFDEEYMNQRSFCFDLKILWLTFIKIINNNDVSH